MKTYNNIVVIAVCIMVGLCAGLIIWAQPLNGDLTRIGAYPERWYGWNTPQQKIPDQSNTTPSSSKKHLLVLGDSFSEIGHWQAYLSDQYSFTFVHTRNTSAHKIIEKIKAEKPDGVIIESVERFAYAMLGNESQFMGNLPKQCAPIDTTQETTADTIEKIQITDTFPLFSRNTFPSNAKEISQGFYLIKQRLFFSIKPKKQQATILELTTASLFSGKRSNQLLVIKSDALLSKTLDNTTIATMQCSMRTFAHLFTDMQLPYVFFIVPDKTTAYQPYLTQADIRNRTPVITRLLPTLGIPHTVNILPAIRNALAHNEADFYLPNDTHWGYKGFQLAAQQIEAALQPQWSAEHP